ncbi:sulfatase-like hydrolase/transferase [Salinirussus salinus]|uniref:sulfatase-like hydrolase/transferase n=1 Tax=Salinirussus salinus TaxID=1198300 RepID=UPI0013592103|nr:sulfatase-like hydrolase/transferase [Salinirussus salinus]
MTERNVVIVTYDSLRADHCGYMGYERDTTPNLDELAEEGVGFTNAISPASRTNPSMAGVFTGEPMVARDRVADPDHARRHLARYGTLAEEVSGRGYTTGAFNPNAYASRHYGFDRGFDHFEDFLFSSDQYQQVFQKHLSDSTLYTLVRNFRNYLRREEAFKTWDRYIDEIEAWCKDQSEPFLLWVFSLDTHFPHLTPRQHREWSSLFEQYYYNWRCNQLIDEMDPDLSEKEVRKIVDIYDDSVRFGDVLLYELQERLAEFDPVYVVFGDHGEAFGERDIYGHFYPSLYEENIHVPLVVSEAVDGIDDHTKPLSLTQVPSIVSQFTGGDDRPEVGNWAVASDYDGRTDRNLIAVRTEEAKQIVSWQDGQVAREETYDLREATLEESPLPIDSSIHETLRPLTQRRYNHEEELLSITSSVADVA